MWRMLLLLGALGGTAAHAEADLHMTFHMALAAEGKRFVGATLVNRGDEEIVRGYLVVTPLDAQCRLLQSVLQPFGAVAPGQQLSVRVAVAEAFHSYRLASLVGFDGQGFVVPAVDDNAAILAGREPEERASCARVRGASGL